MSEFNAILGLAVQAATLISLVAGVWVLIKGQGSIQARQQETHLTLNSRLDQLVSAAHTQGVSDERERAHNASSAD